MERSQICTALDASFKLNVDSSWFFYDFVAYISQTKWQNATAIDTMLNKVFVILFDTVYLNYLIILITELPSFPVQHKRGAHAM